MLFKAKIVTVQRPSPCVCSCKCGYCYPKRLLRVSELRVISANMKGFYKGPKRKWNPYVLTDGTKSDWRIMWQALKEINNGTYQFTETQYKDMMKAFGISDE